MDKYPTVIAQCKNEEDVLRCIDFAHKHELEVAVRSGNHSGVGWGTCEKGLVIDLSKMKGVTVDPVKHTAQVTTGSNAQEILAATAQYGLAPILGVVALVPVLHSEEAWVTFQGNTEQLVITYSQPVLSQLIAVH
jgi:FAD/FMN-containing dehydrogenase